MSEGQPPRLPPPEESVPPSPERRTLYRRLVTFLGNRVKALLGIRVDEVTGEQGNEYHVKFGGQIKVDTKPGEAAPPALPSPLSPEEKAAQEEKAARNRSCRSQRGRLGGRSIQEKRRKTGTTSDNDSTNSDGTPPPETPDPPPDDQTW
ncbi:MAG: hypothetical protein AAB874_07395 [Patescibacteria group bacterium]